MIRLLRGMLCLAAALCAAGAPVPSYGQARDGRVQVTVVDPTGAVVPGATVTIVALEGQAQTPLAPVKTDEKGVATLSRVTPGRYSISAEFPGFDIGLLRDIRVRAGENRHVVLLPVVKAEDSVTVARDTQAVAADRRTSEFGLTLSQSQIEALSDDPAELARQLAELAGPDAIVRVDSFEGQQLPPKAQIKSIHVVRDQFAAEAANPGSTFVDVVTQPGIGAIRGGLNASFRDGSMSGKSQFVSTRGPEQIRNFGANIGGTLVEGRTSFNASVNAQNQFVSPIMNAAFPDGMRAEVLNVRQGNDFRSVNAVVDHAITRDQTLRFGFNSNRNRNNNQGVGNYDSPERAFTNQQTNNTLRIQEAGPIGRRSFINTRLAYTWIDIETRSVSDARTIVVQDAFTVGGAQQHGDINARQMTFASDVDYVRGIHSWRGGVQIEGLWFDSINSSNLNGTYIFSSTDAYLAGQPIVVTQSIGTPRVDYYNLQGAVYFQDDLRIRRGLTLSPGVRYSIQKRVQDRTAFEPRFGFTWAPSANGRTTLRGSVGLFHGWLPPQLIEQTLRMDGVSQREIVITNPELARSVFLTGEVPASAALPSNRYLIGDDFHLQRNLRYSAGIDQVLSPRVRMNVLYNYIHLQQQPRGRNLNPPVSGVRPDPNFANVIESITDAEIRRHEVFTNAIVSLAPPSPALQQAFFNWRRLNINAGYSLIRARNNSAGAWAVPATGNIEDDWGPGPADSPYRVQILMTSNQIRNITANVTYLAFAGSPYNWTTGFDDNGDGLLNDRPAGVGLRTLRGAGQRNLNARVAYNFNMGPPVAGGPAAQGRYRLQLFVNVQNLTNHQNLGGYSGVATSPFFMRPTLATNPRKIDLGMNVNF